MKVTFFLFEPHKLGTVLIGRKKLTQFFGVCVFLVIGLLSFSIVEANDFELTLKDLGNKSRTKIKKAIKINASPRHVPSKIISILEIPKTKNGKLVELAVKQSIEGYKIKNLEALANPDSLKQFKNIKELYE